MKAEYAIRPEAQPLFALARAAFEKTLGWLQAEETTGRSHSEVERQLHREGLELLRLLYEDHLRLRGQAQPVEPVVGAEGVERTHVREQTSRGLETVFGTVTVERPAWSGRGCARCFRPMRS